MATHWSKKTETIEIRVSPEDKAAFIEAAKAKGVSASEAMRALMTEYRAPLARRVLEAFKKGKTMLFASLTLPIKTAAPAIAAVALTSAVMYGPSTEPLTPEPAPMASVEPPAEPTPEPAPEPRPAPAPEPQPLVFTEDGAYVDTRNGDWRIEGDTREHRIRYAPTRAEKRESFDKLDTNGDDAVSLAELYRSAGFDAQGRMLPAEREKIIQMSVQSAMESQPGLFQEGALRKMVVDSLDPSLLAGSQSVRMIFNLYDTDNDQSLSFAEYLAADERNDWGE